MPELPETLNCDANGNLASRVGATSGTTTYTWSAKNQLTQINGPGLTAAFEYDALGRRIARTVNGNTTGFLYDGAQAIAELKANALDTRYHTGTQIDEVLARYAPAGNKTLLTDALNSVIAQASDTQAIENYYAYSPYGEAQTLGPDGGNPLQYTGRENDGTGLMYYRARYYDPVLKRFVSEDPIGLAGNDTNLFRYTYNSPSNFSDPRGLWVPQAIGGTIGAISGVIQTGNSVGWSWRNTGQIALGGLVGGAIGVASSFGFGTGITAMATNTWVGGIAGFAGNVAGQVTSGTSLVCIDWRQAAFQGFVGLVAGSFGGSAFGPFPVSQAAGWAAGMSGAASVAVNSIVSTNLGGFGAFTIVDPP